MLHTKKGEFEDSYIFMTKDIRGGEMPWTLFILYL